MLTATYIEALLVNKDLADQVWEAWDKGEIDDQVAWLAWKLITSSILSNPLLRKVGYNDKPA